MSSEKPKSKVEARAGKTAASTRDAPVVRNQTGRVKHDDRGNAIWEWAVSTGKFTVDTSNERMKRLDNSSLSLADDAPASELDTVKQNPHGTAKGYSPYDSGLLARGAAEVPRKKDLRKLSEWLKLKKQASKNNPDDQ